MTTKRRVVSSSATESSSSFLSSLSPYSFLLHDEPILLYVSGSRVYAGMVGEYIPRDILGYDGDMMLETIMEENHSEFMNLMNLLSRMYERLLISDPSSRKVLVLETPFMSKVFKVLLLKVLFLVFKCPRVAFLNSSLASLFATGNLSGLVVDTGGPVSSVVPVYDTRPLMTAMTWSSEAGTGDSLSGIFEQLLLSNTTADQEEKGNNVTEKKHGTHWEELDCSIGDYVLITDTSRVKELTRVHGKHLIERLKQRAFILSKAKGSSSEDFEDESITSLQITSTTRLQVPHSILQLIRMSIFNPENPALVDNPNLSLHHETTLVELILHSIQKCPRDTISSVCGNIVIIGETATHPGFSETLKDELEQRLTAQEACKHLMQKLNFVSVPFKPCLMPWIGGSLFGMTRYKSVYEVQYKEVMDQVSSSITGELMEDISMILSADMIVVPDWTDLTELEE